MKDGAFDYQCISSLMKVMERAHVRTISEDFDCAQELVKIIGQAWLGIALLSIGVEIDLRFLPLRFWR